MLAQWKIDRIKCASDICSAFSCRLVRKSARLQLLDVDCTLARPVHAVFAHSRLLYRYQATYRTFLYDTQNDLCDFLGARRKRQPMLDVFGSYIERFSNLNHSCPIEGTVSVRDLRYDSGVMRNTIIPAGQYRVDMRLFEPNTNLTVFETMTFVTV